jgi:hypothetical protein
MSKLPTFYVTKLLKPEEIRKALHELPAFLKSELSSDTILTAVYGWGCNLHPDLCYQNMRVGIGWIDKFINDSLRQEIVIPGDSDFTIEIPENKLQIVFCHEGDIHTGGTDIELQKRLWEKTPPYNNFSFFWREGKYLLSKDSI